MDRDENAPAQTEATDRRMAEEVGLAAERGARKLLTLLAVALLLFAFLHFTAIGDRVHDGPAMQALIEGGDLEAAMWFVGATVVLMSVGTPRLLFYALGGFAFGFWAGLGLSLVASLLASFMVFRAARWAAREWLLRRFGRHRLFARIVSVRPTVLSVALVRCLPVSNLVINVGLALSRVRNRAFVWGTLMGFLPQGVVATLLGSGVSDDVALDGAVQLAAAGVIALAFLAYSLWRRRRRAE